MKVENVCSKCGTKVNKKSKFCMECGNPIEQNGKIKCPKCGSDVPAGANFCGECGHKFKEEKEAVKEKIAWNFDSKLITIAFLVCAALGTYLFMSPGFMNGLFNVENGRGLGVLAGIIGAVIIFMIPRKEKFDLQKELDNLKHFKLTLNSVGLVFIICGILIILNIGSSSKNIEEYFQIAMLLLFTFMMLIGLIVVYNSEKLSTSINIIAQITALLGSVGSFILAAYFNNHGNELNSDYKSQFNSIWQHGTANPGNEYLQYSNYALIAGVVLLVLFFILRTAKVKENQIVNILIAVGGILGILFFAFILFLNYLKV